MHHRLQERQTERRPSIGRSDNCAQVFTLAILVILDNLAGGIGMDVIFKSCSMLKADDIQAALSYAAEQSVLRYSVVESAHANLS